MSNTLNDFGFLRVAQNDIKRKGFHIVSVTDPMKKTLFLHSIGLGHINQPEIVFMNTPIDDAENLLGSLIRNADSLPRIEPSMLLCSHRTLFSTLPAESTTYHSILHLASRYYNICLANMELNAVIAIAQHE